MSRIVERIKAINIDNRSIKIKDSELAVAKNFASYYSEVRQKSEEATMRHSSTFQEDNCHIT